MVLAQIQGKKVLISNAQIFKFQLIPYCSKCKFSLYIFSKSIFYIYADYWIEFMMPLHVDLNYYAFNSPGS